MKPYRICPQCVSYAERRGSVLVDALAAHIVESGEPREQVLDRYMAGVHARHLAGLSLAVTA